MNPYRILRVRRNASADAIKSAYRRRAMETHPDRGGDSAEFQAVDLAYKVIADPVRRRLYDDKGIIEEDRTAPRREFLSIVSNSFVIAMRQLVLEQHGRASETDVRERMLAVLRHKVETLTKELGQMRAVASALEEACGRFKNTEGDTNTLDDMVHGHLASTRVSIEVAEKKVAFTREAIAFVQTYRYTFESAEVWITISASSFSSTSTI